MMFVVPCSRCADGAYPADARKMTTKNETLSLVIVSIDPSLNWKL